MSTLTKFWNEQKGKLTMVLTAMLLTTTNIQAQENRPVTKNRGEEFGHTLNLGLGIGYYGYLGGHSTPFLFANYELNVARNFTLAPFIGVASFRSGNYYKWAGNNYYYRHTIIPIGVKGTYYFDDILNANSNWDFYLAGSLGFTYERAVWDNGYLGDREIYRSGRSPLYLDAHIGTEYHINKSVGIFLDLSTGVSTLGLAIHHL